MTVWYLDYAESDTTFSHPIGVGAGIVDINESAWRTKCKADRTSKIFVPFNGVAGLEKGQWDTRFATDVYRTREGAQKALRDSGA